VIDEDAELEQRAEDVPVDALEDGPHVLGDLPSPGE
jgi:hypothetical protein